MIKTRTNGNTYTWRGVHKTDMTPS